VSVVVVGAAMYKVKSNWPHGPAPIELVPAAVVYPWSTHVPSFNPPIEITREAGQNPRLLPNRHSEHVPSSMR
jgi:hypothetical protein